MSKHVKDSIECHQASVKIRMCQTLPVWHEEIGCTSNVLKTNAPVYEQGKNMHLHEWIYHPTNINRRILGIREFFRRENRVVTHPYTAKAQGHFCRERLSQLVPGDGTMGLHAQSDPDGPAFPSGFLIYWVYFSFFLNRGWPFALMYTHTVF